MNVEQQVGDFNWQVNDKIFDQTLRSGLLGSK